MAEPAHEWRVDTPLRRLTGIALVLGMPALIWFTRNVEWGVGIMVWLPAGIAWLLAWALVWRHAITHCGDHLVIAGTRVELAASSLEIAPTAGLAAVIIHTPAGEQAVATWLLPRRASALATWIDSHAAEPLPRTERAKHRLDY